MDGWNLVAAIIARISGERIVVKVVSESWRLDGMFSVEEQFIVNTELNRRSMAVANGRNPRWPGDVFVDDAIGLLDMGPI